MNRPTVCPSTLAEGFSTYSPAACQALFGGTEVSAFTTNQNE